MLFRSVPVVGVWPCCGSYVSEPVCGEPVPVPVCEEPVPVPVCDEPVPVPVPVLPVCGVPVGVVCASAFRVKPASNSALRIVSFFIFVKFYNLSI